MLAEQFYGAEVSGEQMLLDLMEAPTMKAAIELRTDEIMAADSPEIRTPEEIDAAVTEAIHNEARTKLTAATLRFVDKIAKPDRQTIAGIRSAVRTHFENTAVGKIKSRSYSVLAGQASRRARQLLKKGDTTGAALALRQELFNHEAARMAVQVEKATAKKVADWQKLFRSEEKLAEKRTMDLVIAGRALVLAYGGKNSSAMPLEVLESIKRYDPGMFARLDKTLRNATQGNTLQDWRDLTLTDFEALDAAVEALWDASARAKSIEIEGKAQSFESVLNEIKAA
ncbi:MAG: hypothetical protein VW362_06915, partial [Candidatus Nanopelagicales bacterium]